MEHQGGCEEGNGMKDPFDVLRDSQSLYDESLPPWKQSKKYFDALTHFCEYSKTWIAEQEKTIVRPMPTDLGVVRKGTTEWDVFHDLSMKRLKKNGIRL